MTEFLGLAALAVGGYWIVKRMKKKMSDIENQMSNMAQRAAGAPKPAGTLVQDPVTGKYRPQ